MFAAINAFLTRAVSGYFLNKSLRFRSSASAYLSRTPATATNQKTWTWSAWVKLGLLDTGTHTFLNANPNSTTNGFNIYIGLNNANDIGVSQLVSASNVIRCATNAVYRDPAAWYHVVVVIDTTQATNSNGVVIYVNGVIQTLTFNAYTQNADLYVNSAVSHQLGRSTTASGGSGTYFDGEMAEVNFVDGQALAPTAFGAYSTYNQWLPIRYAGTYGTNGFYLPFNSVSTSSYAGSFNGTSQYLSATPATIGSSAFWVEGWLNTSNITTTKFPISLGYDANNSLQLNIDSGLLRLQVTNNSGGSALSNVTMGTLTANTWVYFYFGRGTDSGGTATWYYGINGSITSAVVTTNPTFPSRAFEIGYAATRALAGSYYTGYMSNVRLVVGVTPNTASFTPPVAPLTAISGTAFLTLQSATIVDNSGNSVAITNNGTVVTSVQYPFTLAIAADSSGNANNWTPNNISLTAGSTYDSLTDVPTLTSTTVANYAVLNPLTLSYGTLSEANLKYVGNGVNHDMIVATLAQSTGKWYFETTLTSNISMSGVVNLNSYTPRTSPTYPGGNAASWGYYPDPASPGIYNNAAITNVVASAANGDIVGIALDCDAGTISWYKNNSLLITKTIGAGNWGFVVGHLNANCVVTYGQRPFTYTPPSGFLPLNTFNI